MHKINLKQIRENKITNSKFTSTIYTGIRDATETLLKQSIITFNVCFKNFCCHMFMYVYVDCYFVALK